MDKKEKDVHCYECGALIPKDGPVIIRPKPNSQAIRWGAPFNSVLLGEDMLIFCFCSAEHAERAMPVTPKTVLDS